jgi:hypothetical protein
MGFLATLATGGTILLGKTKYVLGMLKFAKLKIII